MATTSSPLPQSPPLLSSSPPSPFSKLPDELLVEIFLNCIEPDDIGCDAPSKSTAPLLLTWVCHRWRNVAISCPDLWTSITLNDLVDGCSLTKNSSNVLNALDMWISRSSPRPLSFNISYTDVDESKKQSSLLFLPDNEEYKNALNLLIDKLLTCQNRWKALELEVTGLPLLRPLLQALCTEPAAPLLESLQISTSHLGVFGDTLSYDFGLCSKLKTIRILSQVVVPPTDGHVLLNLTELELGYCSTLDACHQWIDKAPNLEILKTRFCTFDTTLDRSNGASHPIRRLEKLRILEISFLPVDSDPSAFLDSLELPVLEDLYIKYNENLGGIQSVIDLLHRSRTEALQALTILGATNVVDVLECLRLCPTLTYLSLQKMPDEILHALMIPEDSNAFIGKQNKQRGNGSEHGVGNGGHGNNIAPLCPLLEVVEVEDSEECSLELLAEFTWSRCTDKFAPAPAEEGEGEGKEDKGEDKEGRGKVKEVFLRHPLIAKCLMRGLDVVQRPPGDDKWDDADDDNGDDDDYEGEDGDGDEENETEMGSLI
ncbi:hypothetical protein PNOK_0868700 [Pyrrhoderma noxium]|uniref:Uncharacterized protein n=1 Tax=Pyrrhoderma noxium TaxID=2282107 RepID=A0A286U8H6_9AGAM|nr:hypothetical protein PNOK_0868700 [Pyrrhoderma noxium]